MSASLRLSDQDKKTIEISTSEFYIKQKLQTSIKVEQSDLNWAILIYVNEKTIQVITLN
jgi:hypothetical protein